MLEGVTLIQTDIHINEGHVRNNKKGCYLIIKANRQNKYVLQLQTSCSTDEIVQGFLKNEAE